MTITAFLPKHFGISMLQVNDELWRITRPSGEILGYISRSTSVDGERFAAKRLMPRNQRFVALGEFWSIDDAINCFRMN
ncbi:hypothetical protein [Humidisolicoccus flavus]|uniref:hypothetical protein n=1 Tax=Humidisolicoccus flavus TaxID=3111414 RepID=UPI003246BB05